MRISDSVANYILELLNQAGGIAEIQRNELAGFLGCVPSQINYVLTSRFTPEQGYLITRLKLSRADMIRHMVNGVGEALDEATARVMLKNMVESGVLDLRSGALIQAGTSEKALGAVPKEVRDEVRAMIVKNMLLATRT